MAMHDIPIPPELAMESEPLDEDDFAAYFDYLDNDGSTESLDAAADDPQVYATHVLDAVPVHRWRVEDDGAAEWACRRLALANEEVRRLREQADDWAARIEAWFVQAAKTPERTATFMADRLEDYALRVRAAGGPSSLVLPSGTVRTTNHKPAVEVDDDETLAQWLVDYWNEAFYVPTDGKAQEHYDDLMRTTTKVYVTQLRKLVGVREVDDGNRAHLRLRCGHTLTWDLTSPDDVLELPEVGEFVTCRACPRLDGSEEPVEAVDVEHLTRLEVVAPDGSEVPGTSVRPGSVTAKAEAR